MALTSPEANLYTEILERLKTEVPELQYIEQDLGQLENYELRPPVAWPCVLMDLDDFDFSDDGGELIQEGDGFVQIRVGLVQYSQSNNLVPDNIRENALYYMEVTQKVYVALHGWAPTGFGRLVRRKMITEKRDDDIRVKVLRFSVSYKDASAKPAKTTVPRPAAVIGKERPR